MPKNPRPLLPTQARLDDIITPEIKAFVAYWESLKGDAFAPSWNDFDLAALDPKSIPFVIVVDVVRDPLDFIIRFWGTAHVARKRMRSAIDGRTTRHESYRLSQRVRKRPAPPAPSSEEIFGWMKTVGGTRKLRYRGTARNGLWFELLAAAYNLVRMAKIATKPVQRPPETAPV